MSVSVALQLQLLVICASCSQQLYIHIKFKWLKHERGVSHSCCSWCRTFAQLFRCSAEFEQNKPLLYWKRVARVSLSEGKELQSHKEGQNNCYWIGLCSPPQQRILKCLLWPRYRRSIYRTFVILEIDFEIRLSHRDS